MNPSPHTLTQAIKQHALDLGFDRAGIARAEPLDGSHLRRWLAAGHHGRMAYMTNHLDLRLDPGLLLPGARSILVGAINYFAPDPDPVADAGLIARYARGDDYHTVLRRKLKKLLQRIRELKPGAEGRICVDSAPLHEKSWAVRAGIGWQGKNSLIISPGIGSWLVLGELVLGCELEPDLPAEAKCGECRRCMDACPTGALVAAGELDARRCLACQTIENPAASPWPEELAARMGRRIFGCDICQEVCPYNRTWARPGLEPAFSPRPWSTNVALERYAGLSGLEFKEFFDGTAVKRATHEGFLRSVCIALDHRSSD